jgi:DNA-binding CsgD family transcriptional regulator
MELHIPTGKNPQAVLKALELLHHTDDPDTINDRIFRCIEHIYPGSFSAFNAYVPERDCYTAHLSRSIPDQEVYIQRMGELVVNMHPFVLQLDPAHHGHAAFVTDFLSLRKWKETALAKEVYEPTGTPPNQALVMVRSPDLPQGVTINKEGRFDEDDRQIFTLLARHIGIAWDKAKIRHQTAPAQKELDQTDFFRLREHGLTRRQCEVAFWMAQGKTDRQIGLILLISPRTVNHHIASILTKLRAPNRLKAVTIAKAALQNGS